MRHDVPEKLLRQDTDLLRALVTALMEMYLRRVSTRRVNAVTEELCGHEFSSATISRMVHRRDVELEKFARRLREAG